MSDAPTSPAPGPEPARGPAPTLRGLTLRLRVATADRRLISEQAVVHAAGRSLTVDDYFAQVRRERDESATS